MHRYQAFDYITRAADIYHQGFSLAHDAVAHPNNPFAQMWTTRFTKASLETAMRLTQRYEKMGFELDHVTIDGQQHRVSEEIVHSKPFCDLVHFKRHGRTDTHKVLLVAPLSGHFATLLKGTVEALLPDHEVYITDWMDAREVPLKDGDFSFACYVDYLIEFMQFLGPNTHLMAICQPAVQSLIATAVMSANNDPARPQSLTLMAGPIDPSSNPTRVNEFAQKQPMSWFRNVAIMEVPYGYPGQGRKVYPGFMQLGGFISMNQQSHMKKYQNFFQNLLFGETEDADRFRAFYDEYLAVLDIPAEFYLETIETVFKNNALMKGTITHHGQPVDFSAITDVPLLTVEGAEDDICGLGQTEAAQNLVKNLPHSMRKHHVQPGAGHYGIFTGSKFRQFVRPIITDFIHQYAER